MQPEPISLDAAEATSNDNAHGGQPAAFGWAEAAAAAARRIGSSGEPISPIEAQTKIARAVDALRRTG